MGLVIYEILVAFWIRINKSRKRNEKKVLSSDCVISFGNETSTIPNQVLTDPQEDVFQISDFIENGVDIVDYDTFTIDTNLLRSPSHFKNLQSLPHCNSLPNSPKFSHLLSRGLSSPYLYGADLSQRHIFDNLYNELAQLKSDLKDIKIKIGKFNHQYYKISTNIDLCNNEIEELNNSDYIQKLREVNGEEIRSIELKEKIKKLCHQLDLCEDAKMTAASDSFPRFYLQEDYVMNSTSLSPPLLYEEVWIAKETDINQNRWSLDFDL